MLMLILVLNYTVASLWRLNYNGMVLAEWKQIIDPQISSSPLIYSFVSAFDCIYSRKSISNYFGTLEIALDIGSHWGFIIALGKDAKGNNLGMSFRSSIK